jgi:predicted dehydrogenase
MEKPIASDAAGAQRLIEAARRTGARLLVGHQRRHNPVVQAARRIVQDGELGKLLAVNLLWAVLKPASYFAIDWRRGPGAGPVLTNLIHEIDLLRCVCGEINAVTAVASHAGRGFAIEDTVAAIVQFANGAVGTITGSDATPSPWSWDANSGENPAIFRSHENVYRLLGSKASLEFPHLKLWHYRDDAEPGWTTPLASEGRSVTQEDAYVLQLRHFCAVVRGEAEPLVSGEDGLRSLAATAAIVQSAALGRTIMIPAGS